MPVVCGLAEVRAAVAGVDVSGLDDRGLAALLTEVRAAQRALEGLAVRIGVRADELASCGVGPAAPETLRGGGAVGRRQAEREAERAALAVEVPGVADALSSGATSGGHVDALARHSRRLSAEQRARFDFRGLLARSGEVPVETFDRLVKRTVDAAVADHGLGATLAAREASEFRHWFDHASGMGRFTGALDPERYEILTNAIDHHTALLAAASSPAEPVTKSANLAARALVELVSAPGGSGRGRVPSVLIVVDERTLSRGPHPTSVAQTETGHDVPPETVARLCCDAVLRRVVLDEAGVAVDVGRSHRTATDAQWAALKAMHSTCAWDGCSAPISWCQAHHVREWEHGGSTDLDNLVPLCSRHHHHVHEGRWRIELLPDRSLAIIRPDGTHHTTVQTPMRC